MKESDAIKLLAALTAAPRWVTALVIADGGAFTWGHSPAWSIGSAALSVLFAAVEVYAAAYIMRAWRAAKPGTQAERVLFALWIVTLGALVAVMAPAIYANVQGVTFASLPPALLIGWSICVAASTFLVIGGVGYADRAPAYAPIPTASKSETGAVRIERIPQAALDAPASVYLCDICGASYEKAGAYAAHMRWKHPVNAPVESEAMK